MVLYSPSKDSLKLRQLETLLLNAQMILDHVITQKSIYEDMVNKRAAAFAGLKILSTRLINALQSTEASPMKIKNAKYYNRKIQGKRAKAIQNTAAFTMLQDTATTAPSIDFTIQGANIMDNTNYTENQAPILDNQPISNTNSAAQLSYTQLVQHFTGLINVLKTEATYMPNEIELQLPNLERLRADLIVKNDNLSNAEVSLSNARLTRDKMLYKDMNSIYKVATEVKKYIKSLYSATSEEYKQISALLFRIR